MAWTMRGLMLAAALGLGLSGCGREGTTTGPESEWETGGNPEWGLGGRGGGDGDWGGMPAPSADASESSGKGSTGAAAGPSGVTVPGVEHGVLTAGSFDDHLNPASFDLFLKSSVVSGLPDLGTRAAIQIQDAQGKPFSGATVTIASQGKTLVTLQAGSDGRALFLPALDGALGGSFQVEVSGGGATASGSFTLQSRIWPLKLGASSILPTQLDLAFVVDATGSMGDEIDFLKAEVAFIAGQIAGRHPTASIRFALIVYRDEGDLYVTRGRDFADLASFQAFLAKQSADGGGDYPEAIHVALEEAASKLSWRTGGQAARVAFLIADAPPHDPFVAPTIAAVNSLRTLGVRLYPVAASGSAELAEVVMRSAAFITQGRYLFLTDDSGVGEPHANPSIPCYEVEKLERLMIRMVASELAGTLLPADPATVIRSVGKPSNGLCQ